MAENGSLRVLLLAGRFELRGSSAYSLRLAEHLAEHRVSPRVFCPDAGMLTPTRRDELHVTEYPFLSGSISGRLIIHLLRRQLQQNKPDLIHIQSRRMHAQGRRLARWIGCPYVLTVHDYLQPRERLQFDPRWCRRIIAVSQSVKSELVSRTRLPEDRITVIHSGVDVATAERAAPVLDPGHVAVVGTAGPLEAMKGLPFFLGAAQKVLAVHSDVEFLILGGGPEESNLRRLAQSLGIAQNVTFAPNLFDLPSLLLAVDVFCLPSLRQGLGTLMLEAMAMGKPVIASGVGGVYSVVRNNETGLVVPPSDSDELSRRILELMHDPVRARAIGEAARRMVRSEFNVEKMVSRTAQVYLEAVQNSRSSSADSVVG